MVLASLPYPMAPSGRPGPDETSQASLVSPLQGKEEFEKTQKELLEKGNSMRQGKGQLELQQVRLPAWLKDHGPQALPSES